MPKQNHRTQSALCCPGCGYNLTGICALDTPRGDCPECGLAFDRKVLVDQQRKRQSVYSGGFLAKLLAMPCVLAFLPVCCGLGGSALFSGATPSTSNTAFVVFVTFGIPLLAVLLASWLLAQQYHQATTLGIPIENRKGMQRHIILPWILFFIVELILTVVYFAGGCALIVAILMSS